MQQVHEGDANSYFKKMIEVGRMCVKIAGRDAGLKCVVTQVIDDSFVMIDGETRRKRCNIKHLEPLEQKLKIKEKATQNAVKKEFKKLGLEIKETKEKKQKTEKPVKKRKTKAKPAKSEEKKALVSKTKEKNK